MSRGPDRQSRYPSCVARRGSRPASVAVTLIGPSRNRTKRVPVKLSPAIVVGALTTALWLAASLVQAAASVARVPSRASAAGSGTQVFADISAQECVRGGGLVIINAVGDGTYTKYCEGGAHDGETIT